MTAPHGDIAEAEVSGTRMNLVSVSTNHNPLFTDNIPRSVLLTSVVTWRTTKQVGGIKKEPEVGDKVGRSKKELGEKKKRGKRGRGRGRERRRGGLGAGNVTRHPSSG
ncbi:hypothetical protein VTH06DRAFT_1463 [Thermothelomyces fergusii]